MGAHIDLVGVDDNIKTDLSMSYSRWGRVYDYMRKNNISGYDIDLFPEDQYYDRKITYTREELEQLVKIAKKEKFDDILNIAFALSASKSKTFILTDFG